MQANNKKHFNPSISLYKMLYNKVYNRASCTMQSPQKSKAY